MEGVCICDMGLADCPNACIDVTQDPDNCGMCGNACGGSVICVASACDCEMPELTYCGPATGCVDLSFDDNNCLACGVQCNGDEFCTPGGCQDFY